jgi:GWxTD domain-containing protein
MNKKIILIVNAILLFGCVSQKPPGTKISASKYNPVAFVLHPKFKVFHENDQTSKIYLKCLTSELRFSSANEERISQALLKINYKVTNSLRGNDILDSAQTTVRINELANQTSIISFFKIKRFDLERYFMEINIVDYYSGKKSQSFITINNLDNDNSQYYLSLKAGNNKPVFEEYFNTSDTFRIFHSETKEGELQVNHYSLKFDIAQVPYSSISENELKFESDSTYMIEFVGDNALFYTLKKGIYLMKAEKDKLGGIMKVNFNKNYPLIVMSGDLLEAAKYILTNEEYDLIKNSNNKKLALDNFWLSISVNQEQARELLKIWYNRATYANLYFTSYKEGYKTDRGMIYMVMGPPDDIQPFDDAEKWIYYNSKEDTQLEFIFVQQLTSISDNDFTLIRETKYEPYYKKALKSWRDGVIYDY